MKKTPRKVVRRGNVEKNNTQKKLRRKKERSSQRKVDRRSQRKVDRRSQRKVDRRSQRKRTNKKNRKREENMIRIIGGAGEDTERQPKGKDNFPSLVGEVQMEKKYNKESINRLIQQILKIDDDTFDKLFGEQEPFFTIRQDNPDGRWSITCGQLVDDNIDKIKRLINSTVIQDDEELFDKDFFLKDFQTLKEKEDILALLQGQRLPLTFVVNFLRVIKPKNLLEATKEQLGVDLSRSISSLASVEGVAEEAEPRPVTQEESDYDYLTGSDEDDPFGVGFGRKRKGSVGSNVSGFEEVPPDSRVLEGIQRMEEKKPGFEKERKAQAAAQKAAAEEAAAQKAAAQKAAADKAQAEAQAAKAAKAAPQSSPLDRRQVFPDIIESGKKAEAAKEFSDDKDKVNPFANFIVSEKQDLMEVKKGLLKYEDLIEKAKKTEGIEGLKEAAELLEQPEFSERVKKELQDRITKFNTAITERRKSPIQITAEAAEAAERGKAAKAAQEEEDLTEEQKAKRKVLKQHYKGELEALDENLATAKEGEILRLGLGPGGTERDAPALTRKSALEGRPLAGRNSTNPPAVAEESVEEEAKKQREKLAAAATEAQEAQKQADIETKKKSIIKEFEDDIKKYNEKDSSLEAIKSDNRRKRFGYEDLKGAIQKTLKNKELNFLESNGASTEAQNFKNELEGLLEKAQRIIDELKKEKQQQQKKQEGDEEQTRSLAVLNAENKRKVEELKKKAEVEDAGGNYTKSINTYQEAINLLSEEDAMKSELKDAQKGVKKKFEAAEAAKAAKAAKAAEENKGMTPLQIFTLSIFNYIKLLWKTQLFHKSITNTSETVSDLVRRLNSKDEEGLWRRYYIVINLVSQLLLSIINGITSIKNLNLNDNAKIFINLIKGIIEDVDRKVSETTRSSDTKMFNILADIGRNILEMRGIQQFMKHPKNGGYCQKNTQASRPKGEIKDCCDGVQSSNCEITDSKLLEKLVETKSNIEKINIAIKKTKQFETLKQYSEIVPLTEEEGSKNTDYFINSINRLFGGAIREVFYGKDVVERNKELERIRAAQGNKRAWS